RRLYAPQARQSKIPEQGTRTSSRYANVVGVNPKDAPTSRSPDAICRKLMVSIWGLSALPIFHR
ncbi:MAG: hypothetical protein ACIWVG_11990, partial [Gloeotrichia echinulata HAB0833]